MSMSTKTIGEIVQGAGAGLCLIGAIAGFHHLLFSIPVAVGAIAVFVGKKISSGSIAV